MKLCGCVNWHRIGRLIALLNLLFLPLLSISQNLPPVLDRGIPNQHAEAGSAFSYTLPGDAFKDENGDQLSYSISALPSGWNFNPASKTITATPLTAGTINVNVNASDGNGASGTANFQITVHNPGTYAAFKMDYQMGCGYRQVRFTNLSKGASTYNWTFGNGNSSTLANPSAIYNTPGRYRVTLLINQGLSTESTHSEYINIYPRPQPAIGAVGTTGCEPVDLSISSTGTPVAIAPKTINGQNVEAITGGTDSYHYWYFFEKHPATFNTSPPNVNVSQLADGKYNVLLEVTDQYGCQASTTAFELFEVDDRPEAAFNYTKSNSCEPSLTVFNDASTVKNSTVSNYQWTINNNSVSEDKAEISFDFSPLGTGSYPVSLVSTSAKGCVSEVYYDTLSFNTINSVDFLTNPLYYTGDTVHLKALSVEPALRYQWDIENNNSIESIQQEFDYTFLTPGIHPVKLIAAYPDACELELVKNLNIDQVAASFSYTTDYKCSVDSFEVSFNNTSTTHLGNQIVSQNWYLIDGDSTLLSTEAQFTHTLANEGDYVVLLETTDINNRKGSITDTLTLNTPGVKLYVTDGTLSCFDGSPTQFRADFESDFERAVSYNWDFGDGQTGTGPTPDHIYATPGVYDISVNVTTNKGCTYTASRSDAVALGFKPVIDKVVPVNASACYNDGVELEITYTGTIDQLWLIDTNNRREYTNPGNSPYQFNYAFEDTGKFEIQIITSMNGCFSDTTIVKDVLVDGPRAEFSPSQNTFCAAPYDVTFYNNSSYEKSNTSFTWDFGDGTVLTTDDATRYHSYAGTGNYDITLTATNTLTGCTNSYTETIDIFSFDDSGAVITADILTGCVPLTVNFTEQLTSRFSSNYNSQLFEWDFNNDGIIDDTTSNSGIEHTFTQPGSYDVRIVAVGADGCNYEYLATDFIRVKGPIVDFSHAPALTCTDTEITFSNQSSKPFFDTAILSNDVFTWNFGDGNSSTLENPKHLYAVDSVYTVSLTIEDQNGCIATKTDSQLINIIPFEPALVPVDTVTCSNNSIVFSNQSTGNIVSFKWDFDGNGTVDSITYDLASIEYNYPVSGSYKALLTAEAADGCTKTDTVKIRVIDATANFSVPETNIGCAPAFAYFTPDADASDVLSYFWSFGDGNTSTQRNPKNYYVTPGIYDVTLTVNFKGSCSRTISKAGYITADGAFGIFDYDLTAGCAPNKVNFSVSSLNRVSYIDWDFGTGIVERDTITSPTISTMQTSYAYDTLGYRLPKIILTDSVCGQYAYDNPARGSIYTSTPPASNYSFDFDSICQGYGIQFTDQSVSTDPLYDITAWQWDFGPAVNDTSTAQNPIFAYPQGGTYSPTLITYNQLGCSDTLKKEDAIFIYNSDDLSADFDMSKVQACAWEELSFTSRATAGNGNQITSYSWDFGTVQKSGTTANHRFADSLKGKSVTVYHIVTDDKFCTDSTSHTVAINNLQAAFGYDPQPVFRGSTVDYTDLSTTDLGTIDSWTWNFGDGQATNYLVQNPQDVSFENIVDNNAVELIVSNSLNCSDTTTVYFDVLNHLPTLGNMKIVLVENTNYTFRAIEFEENFESNDPSQTLDSVKITSNPANGHFRLNGTVYQAGTAFSASQISQLIFYPDANWNGTSSFNWNGHDGYDWAASTAMAIIEVLEEPDPPVLADLVFNVPEDSVVQITRKHFIDKMSHQLGNSFIFDSLTLLNPMELQGGALAIAGSRIDQPLVIRNYEIDDELNVLSYTPANGYNGPVSFRWNANDRYNFAVQPARVIINYYNTAPVLSDIIINDIPEDQITIITKADLLNHFSDVDRYDSPQTLYLSNLPDAGSEGVYRYRSTIITQENFAIPFAGLNELRFQPAFGFEGTTSVTWSVSDGDHTGSALIQLSYVNTPPVVYDFSVTGKEDEPLAFDVQYFNPDGLKLPFEDADYWDQLQSIRIVSLPQNGKLFFQGTPINEGFEIARNNISQLTYLPDTNWNGNDHFEYNSSDGSDFAAADANITITMLPVNDAPRPEKHELLALEDHPLLNLALSGNYDVDDDPSLLTYEIMPADSGSAGANGTVQIERSTGLLSYFPTADFNGKVSFIYTVCDDDLLCGKDTVIIDILPMNDHPTAVADTFDMDENQTVLSGINALFNDKDIDGDSFSMLEVEGQLTSPLSTTYGSLSWQSSGQLEFTLTATLDSLEQGEQVFLPFEYTIVDDSLATGVNTFVIRINGTNDTPVAANDRFTFVEGFVEAGSGDASYSNLLTNDSDPENIGMEVHSLNFSNQSPLISSYGSFYWNKYGAWTFVENTLETDPLKEGEQVSIQYYYTLSDQIDTSATPALITLQLIGVNDAPVASNDTVIIDQNIEEIIITPGNSKAILFNDYDIDNDPFEIIKVEENTSGLIRSTVGTLEWTTQGGFTYTPDPDTVIQIGANASISDEFVYTISDFFGAIDTARIVIVINGLNDNPFATDDFLSIFEDQHLTMVDSLNGLLANDGDIDRDPIVVAVNGQGTRLLEGAYGSLSWDASGAYTYTTNTSVIDTLSKNEMASDVFTYQVSDQHGATDNASLYITITGENDPPVALRRDTLIYENTVVLSVSERNAGIIAAASDVDDHLNFGITSVNDALLTPVSGNFGTLDWNYNGSFTYQLSPSTDTLSAGETVIDSFRFVINDSYDSDSAVFYITIIGENDQPVTMNDTLLLNEDVLFYDSEISLLENDQDNDGDSFSLFRLNDQKSSPAQSRFALFNWNEAGHYRYERHINEPWTKGPDTLAAGDLITDNIPYTIVDEQGDTARALLVLQLAGVNDAPVALPDRNSMLENAVSISSSPNEYLLFNDYDVDRNDSIRVISVKEDTVKVTPGQFGRLEWNIDGAYTYYNKKEATDSLYKNEKAFDRFAYMISDRHGATATDTLTITITGSNDAPLAVNDTISILEDEGWVRYQEEIKGLLSNDVDIDDDPLLVQIPGNETTTQLTGNYGLLNIAANGAASYSLNEACDSLHAGEFLTEAFYYTIADIHSATSQAEIIVNITGQNDVPLAVNDFVQINEDIDSISAPSEQASLLENDTDTDNDLLSIQHINADTSRVITSQYGTLFWSENGHYTFVLNHQESNQLALGDTVKEVFVYQLTDPFGGTDTATFTIEITGLNDAPVALFDVYQTIDRAIIQITPDSINDLLDNDYDVDGIKQVITKVDDSTSSEIEGKWGQFFWQPDGGFTYLPDSAAAVELRPDEFLSEQFVYTIEDEFNASDTSTINISIMGINNAPVAINDTLIVFENRPVPMENGLLFNDYDSDRDSLRIISIEGDKSGIIKGVYGEIEWTDSGSVVFTAPNPEVIDQLGPNQTATETYTYTVEDEAGATASAGLTIKIIGENDPVTALNDSISLYEDSFTFIDVMASVSDPDNNYEGNWAKTPIVVIEAPKHGSTSVNSANGEILYQPDKEFNGSDSLKYRACDNENSCASAWIQITVLPVNDPPVARHLILRTPSETPVSFNAFDQVFDVDDNIDPSTLNLPDIEQLSRDEQSDSIVIYTPSTNFTGIDEFVYSLADSASLRAYVIVSVIVQNEAGGAQNDVAATPENQLVQLPVLLNDTLNGFVPDPLSVDLKIMPLNGTASYDPFEQIMNYQPDNSFNGFDSLTYLVASKDGIYDFATVYITVEPVNSPIVANDDAITTTVNKTVSISILNNDYDDDNGIDQDSVKIIVDPAYGSCSYNPSSGLLNYTPNADFIGMDELSYRVCDLNTENQSCDDARVIVLVKRSNSNAVLLAKNDHYETKEDSTIVLNNPHPIDNDETYLNNKLDKNSFELLTGPEFGSYQFDQSNSLVSYTPALHFSGLDRMTYQVCDTDSSCDLAEINIMVSPVNSLPVAGNDHYMVTHNERKRLYILSNDYDSDGSLDWTSLDTIAGEGPRKGTIEFDRLTGTILYTPGANADIDQFTYNICDDEGACTTANVKITIDLGSTILYHQLVYEDTPDTFDIAPLLARFNLFASVESISALTEPEMGSWESISNNTQLVYLPAPDSIGSDYYNVLLLLAGSDTADLKISVTILPMNDAPTAVNDTVIWNTDSVSTTIPFDKLLSNDFDIDGDSIYLHPQAENVSDPLHIIFNNDSTITLMADTIYWCDSRFSYQISDPDGAAGTGWVWIVPQDQHISAQNDSVAVDENSQINFEVLINDSITDQQLCTIDTVSILAGPFNGIAASTDLNNINYRPHDHYYGPDSLRYRITNLWGVSDSAWVYIDVLQRNQPPVALDDLVEIEQLLSVEIELLSNDYDPDPDGFIDSIKTYIVPGNDPQYGDVYYDSSKGTVIYTPDYLSCTNDQFTYTIFDNEGDSATATVSIVMPSEVPVFAFPDTVKTWPGLSVEFNVLANDSGYFVPLVEYYSYFGESSIEQTGDSTFLLYPGEGFMGKDSMSYQLLSPCDNQKTGWVIFIIEELRVPEIITPNGDGKNDQLIIDGIEYFPASLLQIFNRYGHVVYQHKGYDNQWNGYSNQGSFGGDQPLPSGTYYYTLTYNEGRNKQAGIIYIFR